MYTKHDIHLHTALSSCAKPTATIENYLNIAKHYGLNTIGITDHMWDSKIEGASGWYKPQDFLHINKIREQIPEDTGGIKILFGCETEFTHKGTLAISEEVAEKLDFVLAPHSHTHMLDFVMPREYSLSSGKYAEYLLKSFMLLVGHPMKKYITAIPHPMVPLGVSDEQRREILSLITDSQYTECFSAAKEANIGIEINTSIWLQKNEEDVKNSEYIPLFTLAKKCGCKFCIGSDAHGLGYHEPFIFADLVMDLCGITPDDFIDLVR
jgi:HisJ family histidinol phosphate phosphatase